MLNIFDNIVQQSKEWHDLRATSIGASDAPIIMGVSPWKTPFQLYEEKVFRKTSETTDAMRKGLILEVEARKRLEILFSIEFNPVVCFHSEFPFLIASLDGLSKDLKTIVEIKCPGKDDHHMAANGKIPDHYYPQLQHQMMVTGHDINFYYSFDGEDGFIVPCKRNNEYINELMRKEIEFYEFLKSKTPPPLSDRDCIKREDDEWKRLVKQYQNARYALNQAEKDERDARDALIALANEKNTEGCGIKLLKITRKGNIDYSLIPELMGIDIEIYRKKDSVCWRIF